MSITAFAEINLSALRHNLNRVKQAAPNSKCMAVIKANAYGHGLIAAAEALQDADAFGVARFYEAMILRQAGIDKQICVLEGVDSPDQLDDACAQKIDLVFHENSQLDWLEQTPVNEPLSAWFKVDTGMHRLGFKQEDYKVALQRLQGCRWINPDIKIMSHFAYSYNLESHRTLDQLHRFEEMCQDFAGEKSLANSGAILGWPDTHYDWVRPGIMLYGSSPIMNGNAEEEGLRPVMTLRTRLIAVKDVPMHAHIGYGGNFICHKNTRIGVAAIGYGDGYPRHAKNDTPVLVNGVRCRLVGHVSMDMITIDLEECPDAKVGDEVTLWGKGLSVDEVAHWSDTIAYELLCRLTDRVHTEIVDR
jgi:alanine racemase